MKLLRLGPVHNEFRILNLIIQAHNVYDRKCTDDSFITFLNYASENGGSTIKKITYFRKGAYCS